MTGHCSTGRGRRGFTLLEVLVAFVVLATAGTALQRLVTRSVVGIADDTRLTRALLLARSLLAEAELTAPPLGRLGGDGGADAAAAQGLRFERDVLATPHPALREVRVRVYCEAVGGPAVELVEVVRVPPT
jgi:type II secretion system protein I